eukprot:CAMPEP_0181187790 /NCGR_PEP_ID=MMETSP1096-20121128/10764_1 /TAXON_ID=156174 ORGANISM="Chrysochromulina ericina, Strain CCMP281" /NCGR_SAMPLE_ID=MMETSP1096 /ASSEMBLY_ACC=CAM_ASM_000453 /LENGTH=161 /DNA_ID=CAMNT_0023276795 /DNA_START=21 /DNA_END=504 /DNA_ORIENTATION=-
MAAAAHQRRDSAVSDPCASGNVEGGERLGQERNDVQAAVGEVAPAKLQRAEGSAARDEGVDASVADVPATEELQLLQRWHRFPQQRYACVTDRITALEGKRRERMAAPREFGNVSIRSSRVRQAQLGQRWKAMEIALSAGDSGAPWSESLETLRRRTTGRN